MSEIIICPTGLTGRIRGMKVREERILSDRKLAKAGGQVDELRAPRSVRQYCRSRPSRHRPAPRRPRDPTA